MVQQVINPLADDREPTTTTTAAQRCRRSAAQIIAVVLALQKNLRLLTSLHQIVARGEDKR